MHADFRLNKDLVAAQCRFFERLLILLAFLFLAVWATSAYADFGMIFEWRDQTGQMNRLRLLSTPCVEKKVLAHINEPYHSKFQASQLIYQGKTYEGCWMAYGGVVHAIDESGDALPPIPYDRFKKDDGV